MKTNTNFNMLPKAEYKEGFDLCFKNAINFLDSAKILFERGKYSHALSFLISCNEELTKAFLLRIKVIDFSIRIKSINAFFKDHKIKHRMIVNFFITIFNEEYRKEDKEKMLIVAGIILIYVIYIMNKYNVDINLNDFKKLTIENLRKKVLNVDYLNDKKKWNNPLDLLEKENCQDAILLTEKIISFLNNNYFDIEPNTQKLKDFLVEWDNYNKILNSQINN